MAGFMCRLKSYDFPGEFTAHAQLRNGQIVVVDKRNTAAAAADAGTKLAVVESNILMGDEIDKGIRVRVDEITAGKYYYLVENADPLYNALNYLPIYDTNEIYTEQGALVRMHRLEVGEEFVTNLWDVTPGTTVIPAIDTVIGVLADGLVG